MKTYVKTFKVKDLLPKIVIPRHQRWKDEPHIKTLNTGIVKNGFLTTISLYELENELYSLEDGYQRLSSIQNMPNQEVHCVIIPKDSGVLQDDVFLDLNRIKKMLTPFDFIRYHATKPTANVLNLKDTYQWLWINIFKEAKTNKDKEDALYGGKMFTDAAIKDFFTDKFQFNDGQSKLLKRATERLELYNKINQNWKKDYNNQSETSWSKSNHKLRKTTLVVQLNKLMKLNLSVDETYSLILGFAIYVNENLESYLTPNKDNLTTLYNKYLDKAERS